MRSFRTNAPFFSIFNILSTEGPTCLTTVWTQLTYRFNGRTDQPLDTATHPGCEESTSRCRTPDSVRTLIQDEPVIPRVAFILWVLAFPYSTSRSLKSTFVSVWHVCLTVRQNCIFKLPCIFKIYWSYHILSSVTL